MSKRDSVGRRRHPNQDAALAVTRHEGRTSRSHNISADPATHKWFAELTPQERGDVIERARCEYANARQDTRTRAAVSQTRAE